MAIYIDANKLKRIIIQEPTGRMYTDDIVDEIDKQPAADVRPERHGRCVTEFDGLPFCSECGCNDYGGMLDGMAYCPNCGAKMDKE